MALYACFFIIWRIQSKAFISGFVAYYGCVVVVHLHAKILHAHP